MLRTFSRLVLIASMTVALPSCLQTIDENVELNDEPEDDRGYIKSYDQASRDHKVVNNFETRYTLTSTYLSPEFRAAFAKRFESLFNAPQPFLEEASSKLGFFVSIFSPERDGYDLTNEQLWSIQLRMDDKAHKPVLIKRLDHKSRWRPFFLAVHQWSEEYLILFDTPSVSLDDRLVKKNQMKLMFANSDAKVALVW